jgi:hypothetical protein
VEEVVEELKRKVKKRVKRNSPPYDSTLGQTPGSIHMLLAVAKASPVLKIKPSWTQ